MNPRIVSAAVAASTLICGLPAFAQFQRTENTEAKKVTAILNTFQLLDELEPGACEVTIGQEFVRLTLDEGSVTKATAETGIEVTSPTTSIIALGVTPPQTSSGEDIDGLTSSATIAGLATGANRERGATVAQAQQTLDELGINDSKLKDKILKASANSLANSPASVYSLSEVMSGSSGNNQVDAGLISGVKQQSQIKFELDGINLQDLQSDSLASSENIMFDAYVVCEPVLQDVSNPTVTPILLP